MMRLRVNGWATLAILLGAICASAILFGRDSFPDQRYNLGVARRSALPVAQYPLETSMTFMHYEFFPSPRPEDWHRGLSVLALSWWARWFGQHELLMRIPHLAYAAAWVVVFIHLYARLIRPTRQTWWIVLAGFFGCLILFEPLWRVLTRSYLDDLPAALLALTGIACVLSRRTYRNVAAAGALMGLASFAKDFYLLWGPIAVLLVVGLIAHHGERAISVRTALKVALFSTVFFVTLTPRLLWSKAELGDYLANPIRHWVTIFNFGLPLGNERLTLNTPSDRLDTRLEYPFFLYDDQSYQSRIAVAGSIERMLSNWGHRPVNFMVIIFITLGIVASPLFMLRLTNRQRPMLPAAREVALVFLISVGAYMAFFVVGLGEALQLRYWIVPITLLLLLLIHEAHLTFATAERRWSSNAVVMVVILVTMLPFYALSHLGFLLNSFDTRYFPFYEPGWEVMAYANANLRPGEAVSAHLGDGTYYWSLYPQDRVATVAPNLWQYLPTEDLRRFFDLHRIRFIFVARELSTDGLRAAGMVERFRAAEYVLFEYPLTRSQP